MAPNMMTYGSKALYKLISQILVKAWRTTEIIIILYLLINWFKQYAKFLTSRLLDIVNDLATTLTGS